MCGSSHIDADALVLSITGKPARTGSRSRRRRGSRPRRRRATSPTIVRNLGCVSSSSFTAIERSARGAPAVAGRADRRPGRSSRWRRRGRSARRARAPARSAARGSRIDLRARSAELPAERLEGGRRQRPRVLARGQDQRVADRHQRRAASPPRPCRRAPRRPRRRGRGRRAQRLGSDFGQRRHPVGVVRAVEQRQRVLIDDLRGVPARGSRPRPRRRRRRRARPRYACGGRSRQREVPPLERSERDQRHARVGAGLHDRRAALRGHALGDRVRVGMQAVPEHERRAAAGRRRASRRRSSADRRPEPARVLEPDARQHLHLRRDHVGGVVAAAEPGLDHRHLRPRAAPARSRPPRSAARTG